MHSFRNLLVLAVIWSIGPALAAAEPPPIERLSLVTPLPKVFQAATRLEPLEIRTEEEAARFFSENQLARLLDRVDLEKQVVLIFAWSGSGQDRLEYTVAESDPEQITFQITPGRTRDLRQHQHLYLLRKNVTWSVERGGF